MTVTDIARFHTGSCTVHRATVDSTPAIIKIPHPRSRYWCEQHLAQERQLLEVMADTGLAPKLLRFWDARGTAETPAIRIPGVDLTPWSVGLVREYVPGIPLHIAKRHGVRFSTTGVEDAIQIAHERGYANLDVCDVNTVITFAAQAFLFDWGPYGGLIRRGAVSDAAFERACREDYQRFCWTFYDD